MHRFIEFIVQGNIIVWCFSEYGIPKRQINSIRHLSVIHCTRGGNRIWAPVIWKKMFTSDGWAPETNLLTVELDDDCGNLAFISFYYGCMIIKLPFLCFEESKIILKYKRKQKYIHIVRYGHTKRIVKPQSSCFSDWFSCQYSSDKSNLSVEVCFLGWPN